MQLSTVMLRAGLGIKATKPQHIANAVKQVFAHEYREQHDGGTFFFFLIRGTSRMQHSLPLNSERSSQCR